MCFRNFVTLYSEKRLPPTLTDFKLKKKYIRHISLNNSYNFLSKQVQDCGELLIFSLEGRNRQYLNWCEEASICWQLGSSPVCKW